MFVLFFTSSVSGTRRAELVNRYSSFTIVLLAVLHENQSDVVLTACWM